MMVASESSANRGSSRTGRHGVIGIEGPASFFRTVQVRSEVLGSRGTVAVPGRRRAATPPHTRLSDRSGREHSVAGSRRLDPRN
jgi:hypothetical protein